MKRRKCEYFSGVRKNFIYCEAARFKLENKEQRNLFCKKFCNKTGEKNKCPLKKVMDEFYLSQTDKNDI